MLSISVTYCCYPCYFYQKRIYKMKYIITRQQQQQYHYSSTGSFLFVLLVLLLISTDCNWKQHVSSFIVLHCQSFSIIATTIPRYYTLLSQSHNSLLLRYQYNNNYDNIKNRKVILPTGTTTTTTTTTTAITTSTRFQSQLTATKKTTTGNDSKNSKKRLVNGGSNGFGGGGGFGKGTTTTTTTKTPITATTTTTTTKEAISNNNNQKQVGYDKWGLPLPTIDDIFPPMLNGTIIIPVDRNSTNENQKQEQEQTLETILDSLQNDIYCLQSNHIVNIFHYNNCTIKVQQPTTTNNTIHQKIDKQQQTQIQIQNQIQKSSQQEDQSLLPMKIRLLHHTPAVIAIDNFFTKEECTTIEHIIDDQQNSKQQSQNFINNNNNNFIQRVNSATFSSTSNSNSNSNSIITKRTSTSWFCNYQLVPTLIAKCCYLLNININQIEEPQIVQYNIGQQFTYHYDIIPNTLLQNGGQRIATVLVYLNTIPQQGGGQTIFRDLKNSDGTLPLSVSPQQGTALLFFPSIRSSTSNFIPDDRTLHKGEIVQDGYTKNIIQLWIHEHSNYTAVLPSSYLNNKQCDAIPAVNHINEQYGYPLIL